VSDSRTDVAVLRGTALSARLLERDQFLADLAGLRNAEIAETLHVSHKTAEHHVSAVLAKLNARSRAEAVSQAHNLGVIAKMGGREQPT